MSYNFYESDDLDFALVTDTHFGRIFKDGISLDRRGEYEERMYNDFKNFIESTTKKTVIHAGDLFESPYVSNEVLMRVYKILKESCKPLTHYYFLAGNHDIYKEKDREEYTSFYILSKLLSKETNIHFVMVDPQSVDNSGDILLIPYNYFKDVNESVNERLCSNTKCIIGHFEDPTPVALWNFTGEKYSGHFHKRHLSSDGTLFIGSFYPIAFGEESDTSLMETMTLEEYHKRESEDLKDKRIRIILREGEELPVEHECLQLIGKRIKEENNMDLEVKSSEDFDFKELFMKCLQDTGIADELWNRYIQMKGTSNVA